MKVLNIDKANFLKGMSLTVSSGDGGFSPESLGIEIDRGVNLGLLTAGRSLTDYSTGLGGEVVTNVKFKVSGSGGSIKNYLFCTNGKIYESDPLIPPGYSLKDTATLITFSSNSHAIVFRDILYVSGTTDIFSDDFSFTSPNDNWWTGTQGKTALTAGVPHKLFEFGNILYCLNGNKIASWDGTTAVDDAFTLPLGYIITDVAVDNDLVYLTIVKHVNDYSVYTETKIIVWNGISPNQWLREVPIFSTAISAIKKVDNGFIFFSARNIFYFDGYNYQWIRKISNTPTFNQVTAFNGNIYYADNGVSCYNTRFKIFSNPVYLSYTITINVIDISYLDYIDLFYSVSSVPKWSRALTNNATTVTFYSDWYDLSPSYIRKYGLIFSTALATNSEYTVRFYDETDNVIFTDTISKTLDGAKSAIYKKIDKHLNLFKITITFNNSANSPIKAIKVFYEQSEHFTGK